MAGATGTPGITPPATDVDAAAANNGNGWRFVLLGLAMLIAALSFAAPTLVVEAPKRQR